MTRKESHTDVSAELSALRHEMKNQKMKSLPINTTIQRRPLHHAPVASPYAGANVQKIVYVSNHTPIMSAVKRVKKLLSYVEKRAVQSVKVKGLDAGSATAELVEVSNRLAKTEERVLVKASGRAMQQALRIGEWFRSKEKEMICNVEVRTGGVQAVDDIVEVEDLQEDADDLEDGTELRNDDTETATVLEGGETTMELLGSTTISIVDEHPNKELNEPKDPQETKETSSNTRRNKKKRFRRKRAVYDVNNVPEARLRWVKTVEIAISLKA